MKKNIISAGLLLSALGGCTSWMHEVPNDPDDMEGSVERTFDVPAFQNVKTNADARLIIQPGNIQSVTVRTAPEHFQHLSVDVIDGRLEIEHDRHRGREYVEVFVTLPYLSSIRIDAVIDAMIGPFEADAFTMDFNGVGSIVIEGSCTAFDVSFSGVGDIDATEFFCNTVAGDVSGIGDAAFFASDSVSIDVSGIGDVSILGQPTGRNVSASGFGDVTIVEKQD